MAKTKQKELRLCFCNAKWKKGIWVQQVWFDVNETKLLTDQRRMQITLAHGVGTFVEYLGESKNLVKGVGNGNAPPTWLISEDADENINLQQQATHCRILYKVLKCCLLVCSAIKYSVQYARPLFPTSGTLVGVSIATSLDFKLKRT